MTGRRGGDPQGVAEMAERLLGKLRGSLPAGELEPDQFRAGERVARQQRDEEAATEDRAKRRRLSVDARIKAALPSDKLIAAAHEATETDASRAALSWFTAAASSVLLLRGGIGVGKTMAAAMVVRAAAEQGQQPSWHRPNDFVSAVLHQYDESAPRLSKSLVVIDDVGRETKSDFAESLCTLLDDYDVRVLMTTNLSRDEFRARYDARLLDRLNEVGMAVSIKGESRRRKGSGF